jgi:hypothetical protein
MQDQRTEAARAILAWGLVWGAAEASLGHILHGISVPGLAGLVMAPIGLWAMARAVKATGRPAAAIAASALAAAVKLADVFLPGRGPVMAIRPALAILAEGLLVAAAFAIAAKASWPRAERRPAR